MDSRLFEAARTAMARAHAPYSRFRVGAAILADDGVVYAGCNVENASYPEGCCAETSAISAMVLGGAKTVIEIAIIADGESLTTPCGGCRQRIAEFGSAATAVHVMGPEGLRRTFSLGDLLPHSFGKEHVV